MNERFELPSELTIYSALETRDALLAWVTVQLAEGHDHLEVSAQHVAEVDGAGLQLLAALSNMEYPWRLVETSGPFDAACRVMGFGSWVDTNALQASREGARA